MGMSTHIIGVVPPDAAWKRMADVWHSCEDAGVPIPKEVTKFFRDEPPDAKGILMDLDGNPCCTDYTAEMCEGVEIDISKLPKDVKIIRFYNSY